MIEEETPVDMGTGDEPVLEDVEMRTGVEPVHEDVVMGTGDTPVRRMEAGDSFFEDYLGDDFEKVREINLEETPQKPRVKPQPLVNRGGRESKPWLGARIYLGSGRCWPSTPKPLHPLTNPLTNSLSNQSANLTVWLLKGL